MIWGTEVSTSDIALTPLRLGESLETWRFLSRCFQGWVKTGL